MQWKPSDQRVERRPKGFDPGLQCLAAVFMFTTLVRVMLTLALRLKSMFLIETAMTMANCGVMALVAMSLRVWLRRRQAERPPRGWAAMVALVWASGQMLTHVLVMFRTFVKAS